MSNNGNLFTKYYGEYSLEYWIKLLLKGDIVLPDFQRPYVWDEKDIMSYLDSIQKKQFIPPVIIGKFIDKNEDGTKIESNIILDGQQRLCSLIFAYYQIFPDSNNFKEIRNVKSFGNEDENDGAIDESKNSENKENNATSILSYIQKKFYDVNYNNTYSSIEKFSDIIKNDDNFKKISDGFIPIKKNIKEYYEENYIPFIYIKPSHEKSDTDSILQEKNYYSNLFYNINKKGIELNNQECRNAMVWLSNKKWKDFFDEFKFLIYIRGKEINPVDFSYYLSILSFIEYKSNGKVENIKNIINNLFGNRYIKEEKEDFILKFLNAINEHNNKKSESFGAPNDLLDKVLLTNDGKFLKLVKLYIDKKSYESVADFEIEFIGLMYWVLFKGKEIELSLYENKIKEKIKTIEGNTQQEKDKYRRNVNKPNNLRERIVESINIFK